MKRPCYKNATYEKATLKKGNIKKATNNFDFLVPHQNVRNVTLKITMKKTSNKLEVSVPPLEYFRKVFDLGHGQMLNFRALTYHHTRTVIWC